MNMIKLVAGLLTYKLANKKYYDKNLSTYPEGFNIMHNSL